MTTSSTDIQRLLTGTATKYLVLALNVLTGVFLMPFTVRHLGAAEYGLWMLVATLTSYFQLLDLGYGNGIVRHVVEADTLGRIDQVNAIVSTFFMVYVGIGLAALAVTFGLSVLVVPRFPHLTPADIATGRVILLLLGLRASVAFPMTVFGALTNARRGFAWNSFVAAAVVVATALVTYVVLIRGGSVVQLVTATTAVNLAGYIGYVWVSRHVFPEARLCWRAFDRGEWRRITSYSAYLFIIDIATQVSFNIDNVVIGAVLGTVSVAVYTVALRLSDYQSRLCDQFSGMLFPVLVAIGARRDEEALRSTFVGSMRITTTLVVGVGLTLVAFADLLIPHWMGAAFTGSVAPFDVLALATVIVVAHAPAAKLLAGLGYQRLVAGIWIAEAAVNLALSLVFVRVLGIAGVALGTLVPLVVGHIVVMFPRACRVAAISPLSCARQVLRPAAAAILPALAMTMLLRRELHPTHTLSVLAQMAAVGIVYLATVWTFGLDGLTRDAYVRVITGITRRRPVSATAGL